MVTLDWGRYVEAQLCGARILWERADEILGHDSAALQAKAAAMLADGARKLAWELARHEMRRRIGPSSPAVTPSSLAA